MDFARAWPSVINEDTYDQLHFRACVHTGPRSILKSAVVDRLQVNFYRDHGHRDRCRR